MCDKFAIMLKLLKTIHILLLVTFISASFAFSPLASNGLLNNHNKAYADHDFSKSKTVKTQISSAKNKIEGKVYIIIKGDSLWKIAGKTYKNNYHWVYIARANSLSNPSLLKIGDKITLPTEKTIALGKYKIDTHNHAHASHKGHDHDLLAGGVHNHAGHAHNNHNNHASHDDHSGHDQAAGHTEHAGNDHNDDSHNHSDHASTDTHAHDKKESNHDHANHAHEAEQKTTNNHEEDLAHHTDKVAHDHETHNATQDHSEEEHQHDDATTSEHDVNHADVAHDELDQHEHETTVEQNSHNHGTEQETTQTHDHDAEKAPIEYALIPVAHEESPSNTHIHEEEHHDHDEQTSDDCEENTN